MIMDKLLSCFIVSAIIHYVTGYIEDTKTISVKTGVGTFVGVTSNVSRASSFFGIPYAKPPIDELRFAKPVPFGRIKSEYNATYHRPACVQSNRCYLKTVNASQNEDCLYLNIYTPSKDDFNSMKLPVMVYIHGGSFGCGSAQVYDGSILSGYNDIIVVVINYRLGAFGFLSDGSKMTGNYGLWDMHLALHWVHDNIAEFGGDKNAVTIFGNSAGGAAVLFQATQPLNKGLFQRVIAQSGSFLGLWSYELNPRANFKNLATMTGCLVETYTETLQCLRSVPAEELRGNFLEFMPIIDGEFIKQSPLELLNDLDTTDATEALNFLSELDLIVGTNTNDGALDKNIWQSNSSLNLTCEQLFDAMLGDQGCKGYPSRHLKELMSLYQCDYPTYQCDYPQCNKNLKYIAIIRDVMLFVPSVLTARLHNLATKERNDTGSLYYYIFGQRPSYAGTPDWLPGATHFMEVPYIFGLTESFTEELQEVFGTSYPDNITSSDRMFSYRLRDIWTSFARTGIPHSDLEILPKYTQDSQLYLNIESRKIEKRRLQDYPPSRNIETIGRILRQTDERCRQTVNSVSNVNSEMTPLMLCFFASVLLLSKTNFE